MQKKEKYSTFTIIGNDKKEGLVSIFDMHDLSTNYVSYDFLAESLDRGWQVNGVDEENGITCQSNSLVEEVQPIISRICLDGVIFGFSMEKILSNIHKALEKYNFLLESDTLIYYNELQGFLLSVQTLNQYWQINAHDIVIRPTHPVIPLYSSYYTSRNTFVKDVLYHLSLFNIDPCYILLHTRLGFKNHTVFMLEVWPYNYKKINTRYLITLDKEADIISTIKTGFHLQSKSYTTKYENDTIRLANYLKKVNALPGAQSGRLYFTSVLDFKLDGLPTDTSIADNFLLYKKNCL